MEHPYEFSFHYSYSRHLILLVRSVHYLMGIFGKQGQQFLTLGQTEARRSHRFLHQMAFEYTTKGYQSKSTIHVRPMCTLTWNNSGTGLPPHLLFVRSRLFCLCFTLSLALGQSGWDKQMMKCFPLYTIRALAIQTWFSYYCFKHSGPPLPMLVYFSLTFMLIFVAWNSTATAFLV